MYFRDDNANTNQNENPNPDVNKERDVSWESFDDHDHEHKHFSSRPYFMPPMMNPWMQGYPSMHSNSMHGCPMMENCPIKQKCPMMQHYSDPYAHKSSPCMYSSEHRDDNDNTDNDNLDYNFNDFVPEYEDENDFRAPYYGRPHYGRPHYGRPSPYYYNSPGYFNYYPSPYYTPYFNPFIFPFYY